MVNTVFNEAKVIKVDSMYCFTKGGDTLGKLRVVTFTLRNKLKKELKKMKWFIPNKDFQRSDLQLPNAVGKELDKYKQERDAIATWSPVLVYMKSEDKNDVAQKLCSEFLQVENADAVHVQKFKEILEEFSEILEQHNSYGN